MGCLVMNLATGSVKIFEGLVLYRRSRSSAWQCRYKHQHTWLRKSTGCQALDNAKVQATTIWHEAQALVRLNLPVQSKRFKDVAATVVERLQGQVDSGKSKPIDKDYATSLRKYLVPYFGKHSVDKIDAALLGDFDEWRAEQMGKVPTKSTVATHNAALNLVLAEAEQRGWLSAAQRPVLANNGKRGEVRASFSKAEYEVIWRNLRHWVKAAATERQRQVREVLWDYVLVLANTGIRHGTEAMNLKWQDIDWFEQDGERYLRLTVRGKTSKRKGARTVVARMNTQDYLRRQQLRFADLADKTFDDLLRAKVDEYVFRTADGLRTKNFANTLAKMFEAFLREYNLLHSSTSPLKRTLYSLRHMYATLALQDGIGVYQLAAHMGTSVAMIERHYSKFTSEMNAKAFAGG